MDRRHFLTLSAAAAAGTLALPSAAFAIGQDYKPGLVDKALADGKTVFIDFAADWCSTCARQERVIKALQAENPAYNDAITFVRVDWDQYRGDSLTKRLKIPRRSTLVVLKGNKELGRIVAGTAKGQIKALMDTALAAAGSA